MTAMRFAAVLTIATVLMEHTTAFPATDAKIQGTKNHMLQAMETDGTIDLSGATLTLQITLPDKKEKPGKPWEKEKPGKPWEKDKDWKNTCKDIHAPCEAHSQCCSQICVSLPEGFCSA